MFWVHAGLLGGGALVSYLMRDDPASLPEEKPARFSAPRAERGPVAMFYGKVRVDAPFMLWRGNIRNRSDVDGGTGETVYWYEANVALQFGIPPATTLPVKLHRIYIDDRRPLQDNLATWPPAIGAGGEEFTTPLEDGDTGYISDPDFFGITAPGAGVTGAVTFHDGGFSRSVDSEMATAWYVDALGTSREVTDVDASANSLTVVGHGLSANDGPMHVAAATGFYPGGLSGLTDYWVKTVIDADTFTLSASEGGSVIDITSTGSSPIHVTLTDQTGHPNSTLLPAFRGRTWAYFWAGFDAGSIIRDNQPGFIWGNRPTLPRVAGEVEAHPNALTGNLGYIPVDAFGNRYGSNPAEIIADILTNPWGRCGLDISAIDMTSFVAAATTLQTEDFGLNFVTYEQQTARQLLSEIMRCIGAVCYEEPTDGTIHLKLIRDDYTVGALSTFDESNSVVLDYAIDDWQDTTNQVLVRYLDRESNDEVDSAPQQDLANIVSTGGLRSTTNRYIGVTDAQLASNLASRDLRALSQPLTKVRLSITRDGTSMRPGSVFKFTNASLGMTDVVMRVGRMDFGDLTDNRVVVDAIQDVFEETAGSGIVAPPSPPAIPNPQAGCVSTSSTLIAELPLWIGAKLGLGNPEACRVMYLAAQPANASNYSAQTKWPSGNPILANTFTTLKSGIPFAHRFTVETGYLRTLEPVDNAVGLRVTMSAAARATLASEDDSAIRLMGRNLAIIGPVSGQYEILAFGDITLDGLVTVLESVRRGLLGTVPIALPAGTPGWLLPDATDSRHVALTKIFDGDETIVSRILPRNGTNALSASRAPLITQTLEAVATRPLPPQRFFVAPSGGTPANVIVTPVDVGELDATWRRRERGRTLISFGNDADDAEDGVTYYISGRVTEDYAPRYRHPSAGSLWDWSFINYDIDDDEGYVPLDELSHGTTLIRIQAGEDDPTPTDPNVPPAMVAAPTPPGVESWQAPSVAMTTLRYRQLLRNPSFQSSQVMRAWDLDSGTPDVGPGGGIDGGVAVGTDSAGCTFSQRVKVAYHAPVGLQATLLFGTYLNASYAVNVSMGFYDISNSLIETATTTGALTGSEAWTYRVLTNPMPATTHYIRVTVVCTGGGATWRGVDAFDLHIGDTTDQLLTNPTFDSNTTGWTADSGTWASDASANFAGGAGLTCESQGANDTLSQVVALTQNGYHRGTALLNVKRKQTGSDTLKVVLTSRTSGASTIDSTETSTAPSGSDWVDEWLYLDLDVDTVYDLKVEVISISNASGDNSVLVDECRLWVHRDLHPTSEYYDIDFQTPATQQFAVVPTCPANAQTHVWQCQDDAGDLAIIDAMRVQGADFVADAALLLGRMAAGINDADLGWCARNGLEVHAGMAAGTGASVTGSAVMDAGSSTSQSLALDITCRSAVKPAAARGIIGKRLSSNGAGWEIQLTTDGYPSLLLEDDEGTANLNTVNVNLCDGAWRKLRLCINRDADTFRIYTDGGNGSATAIPGTKDFSAAAAFLALFGHTNLDRPESFEIAEMVAWRGAAAEARDDADDFAASWTHASDPTGLEDGVMTYDLADAVGCVVAQGSGGVIYSAFAPGQVPQYLAGGQRYLGVSAADTNLVPADPNDSGWVAGEAASVHALLAAITTAGLGTPIVAVDFSEEASGSFTNHGSEGGTFAPGGSPTYEQAFPSPIGGNGVLFGTAASDYFEASSASIGDTATDDLAVFLVCSGSTNTGTDQFVSKRDAGPGPGWEIRTSSNTITAASVEDDDNDSASAISNNASGVFTGAARYVAMRLDVSGDSIYCWDDASSSEVSAAISGTNTTFTSAGAMRVGKGLRNGFGEGGGKARYLVIWKGANATAATRTLMGALFTELQP